MNTLILDNQWICLFFLKTELITLQINFWSVDKTAKALLVSAKLKSQRPKASIRYNHPQGRRWWSLMLQEKADVLNVLWINVQAV